MPWISIRKASLFAYFLACYARLATISTHADPGTSSSDNVQLDVEFVGAQQILMKAGHHGLSYFPDENICVLKQTPLTFLLVAGNVTWMMQGSNWSNAVPVRKVLEPSTQGPDNGYSGVGGVSIDNDNKKIYAFYHAEDQTGYQKLEYNGVPNFMSSICLADAPLDAETLTKRGPVITGHDIKNAKATQPQGVGDVTICHSPDNQYLLAWYTDHSHAEKNGVQIGMARSPLAERGRSGSWKKWHQGEFQEPGIGGHETPVLSLRESGADAWGPNVVYVPECRRYVMLMAATAYSDFTPGAKTTGGIRMAHSADGIHWSAPISIVAAFGVPVPGKKCAIHPTLIVTRATDTMIEGSVLFGFSSKWGHTADAPPHHLAAQKVRLKIGTESAALSDKERELVGRYRLVVTNISTKIKDPDRTLEIRADRTFKSTDGFEGKWKLKNGKLEVTSPQYEVGIASKSGKSWKGTLTHRPSRIAFTYTLERIGD